MGTGQRFELVRGRYAHRPAIVMRHRVLDHETGHSLDVSDSGLAGQLVQALDSSDSPSGVGRDAYYAVLMPWGETWLHATGRPAEEYPLAISSSPDLVTRAIAALNRSSSAPQLSRSFASAWSLVFMGSLGFVVMCTGLILAPVLWGHQYGLPPVAVLVAFVGIAVFVRCVRVRFRIGADGLLIRNVFRTRVVPWNDAARIGWKTFFTWFSPGDTLVPALAIQLRNGKLVVATATAGFGRSRIHELVAAVHGFATQHAVPVEVTPDDLAVWGWRRDKPPKTPELQ